MRNYLYRSTTDKVARDLDRIEAAGDTVRSVHHTGGRDWVILAIRADETPVEDVKGGGR